MLARCGKYLVVTALVLALGLHWAVLQTVAWTTMLASNLQNDSFSCAVSKTFDGAHPCCLCKAIAAAKKAQKESAAISLAFKMEFPQATWKINLYPPTQFKLLPLKNDLAGTLASKPPVPPPRDCFV